MAPTANRANAGSRDRSAAIATVMRLAAVGAAAVVLSGCAGSGSGTAPASTPGGARAEIQRGVSPDELWLVGVSKPMGDFDGCEDDESVATAVMTADMPPSSLSFSLKKGSDEADAIRVAECVIDGLTGGAVKILAPKP